MSAETRTERAVIIGGGVGGLCAAIALQRIGIDAHVYEKAAMLGDVGAGLVLWANAIRALGELGLADSVIRAGAAIQHGQVRTSAGDVLAVSAPGELEKTFGVPTVAIHRAALHEILLSALPPRNVHLGAERVYWFATANTEPGKTWAPPERKAHLLAIFGDWHHPVRHLLESTPAADILHNDIYDIPPMPRRSNGRITLLGDAAHATTPNLGQGACMAVESAFVLARCVAKTADLPAALREYEEFRRPRTAWITNQSWQIGRVGQWENPLACAARNFVVRRLSSAAMKAQLEKVVGGGPA